MFGIDYKDKRPIYEQLKDGIKEMIAMKVYPPGEKLASVRELSVSLTINPNTVQRAYRELESEGYIHSVAGKGSFVSEALPAPDKGAVQGIYDELGRLVRELVFYREPPEKVQALVQKIYEGGYHD